MIYLKSPEEIKKIRQSCLIIARLLDSLNELIKPGISTWEIDNFTDSFIRQQGAVPSFKGYTVPGLPPFPAAICASVNSVIVHGIPSPKVILKDGDILGVDVGVYLDGYHGDAACTYVVGTVSELAQKLLQVTSKSLDLGIKAAVVGNRVGDISAAIGDYVSAHGFYVADNLTGHGIGRELHESPQVPNSGHKGKGPRLQKGMTIAIEPMVNVGTNHVHEQGWEFSTADNSLSAHFEHTILITDGQPEILTRI
ncbi:MAG: type I methionyl aminopeptidase [Candidatus Cloacimonadaceae bacterium]